MWRCGIYLLLGWGLFCFTTPEAAQADALRLPELTDWATHYPASLTDSDLYSEDQDRATIQVPADSPRDFYHYWTELDTLDAGGIYRFTATVSTQDVTAGVGAMISLALVDAHNAGERRASVDSMRLLGDSDPTTLSAVLFIPEGAWRLRLMLLLHGAGEARFEDLNLEKVATLHPHDGTPIRLAIQDNVIHDHFLGFGLEDDSFFFTDENFRHGINEADIALREERIAELDPKVVPTLFWWDAMAPEHDLDQITFDTELMRALYRTLDVHQAAGRQVLISDTHWTWSTEEFPYNAMNLEKGVQRYLELLEHLILEKGFDCIRYVAVSGEVDLIFEQLGGTFETYMQAVKLLREGLDKRGLTNVQVIGDKSGDYPWFERMIPAGDSHFGFYTLHEYHDVTQYPVVHDRLARPMALIREHGAPTALDHTAPAARYSPAFLWEIGYKDQAAGDTDNQATATYTFDYGLLCAYTAIAAARHGYVGGSVWCLHSMYYPFQNRMDFGLWEFKDRDWRIRPSYYGIGLLTRYIDADMASLEVTMQDQSGQPIAPYDLLATAFRNDDLETQALVVVNMANHAVETQLDAAFPEDAHCFTYTEGRIPSMDAPDYGLLQSMRNDEAWDATTGALQIPARSLLLLRTTP